MTPLAASINLPYNSGQILTDASVPPIITDEIKYHEPGPQNTTPSLTPILPGQGIATIGAHAYGLLVSIN